MVSLFILAKLLHLTWDETFISKHHFYVCPGHTKEKAQQCGGTSSYYCSSWSCVSTGHIWWNPPVKKDLISVSRTGTTGQCSKSTKSIEGTCNPVSITFTPEGHAETRWSTGLWWGVRLYEKTRVFPRDPGAIFRIKLLQQPLTNPVALSPSPVLAPSLPKSQTTPSSPMPSSVPTVPSASNNTPDTDTVTPTPT